MKLKGKHIILVILASMLFVACSQSDNASNESTSSIKEVDKLFKEFYAQQGGKERLGEAISILQVKDGLKLQYLETSVMVFDPLSDAGQRFYFKAIGADLGYYEIAPGRIYPQASDSVIDGYVIYPAFISVYQELGGESFTGNLISSWQINETNGRIEQHFENVGLYINLDDPESKPKLLPYGAMACRNDCREDTSISSGLIDINLLIEPFAADAVALGEDFLGNHLLGAYQNPNGLNEVIFENAVLVAQNGNNRSFPRPIAEELGYANQPLVPPLNNPNVTFILIDQGLGYNIPNFFVEYMKENGSFEFYGLPVSEMIEISDALFRQCFKNLCLEYHANIEDELEQIFPSPLGYQYQSEIFSTYGIQTETETLIENPNDLDTEPVAEISPTPQTAESQITGQLTLWENSALINSNEAQIIFAAVHNQGSPIAQVELVIKYIYPNNQTNVFYFPETDENGYTEKALPLISAENGTIIEYQVCPRDAGLAILCENENFVIWEN
ncbi:MAG: hypothetical protein HON98_05775 [Chloroflexi bacterium]|jgi:hypothetical protein|nr:hypothetical protein [Chloroflexota bacterium]MBT3670536.1 hypothetical protein [Chloroflexota bacterium]MBT4001950.1 hypothetical protein [Chloroflexota bacterium]MBT4304171.1 hypothetical protein [Chloroflexota bacterium]MBT4533470.1 hypothetical protein [Chloroflexota bacterium]